MIRLAAALLAAVACTAEPASAQNAYEGAATMQDVLESATGTNDERMPGHIDSWLSLAIVLASLLVAAAINGERPAVRVAGTVLAALGCLAVPAWFVWALGTGVIGAPRPQDLPTDAAKPALMWLTALAALAAGVFLLVVARWQSRRNDRLALPAHNQADRYGRASRILHWTTAILFLSLIPMGIFTTMIPFDADYRQGYYVAHKTIGLTVLILLAVRLVWNWISPRPALDAGLRPWERRMAHGAHLALYVFMIAFPVTGYVMSTYGGKLSHFFVWDLPLLFGQDLEAIRVWGLLHKIVLPYLFFLVIGAHVLGALKHQFIDGHRTAFRRMAA